MILETVELTVIDGPAFEAAVREALPLFLNSPGCQGVTLHHVVEDAARYRLLIRWATLEDHTVTFRESAAFPQWRALASPFFAAPPVVTHSSEVAL